LHCAAGSIGAPPTNGHQPYEYSVRALGRLTTPEQFGALIVKTTPDGGHVYLRDVGRVELGAEDYSSDLKFNGQSSVGIGVLSLPTANALDVSNEVRATMAKLSEKFPQGLRNLSDQVHAHGMKFGLWVDPGNVDAALVESGQIPKDWLAEIDGKPLGEKHPSLTPTRQLCLGNPKVVTWIKKQPVWPDVLCCRLAMNFSSCTDGSLTNRWRYSTRREICPLGIAY